MKMNEQAFLALLDRHHNFESSALMRRTTGNSVHRFDTRPLDKCARQLLTSFNRPMAVIHLVGTNGKGSTAFFLEQLYGQQGTGRFTSPHLVEINERICVDGQPVAYEQLASSYLSLKKRFKPALFARLSFFDIFFLTALDVFYHAGCRLLIIEAGLGGRYDSTRFARGKLGLLTSVGLDHVHLLGNSLDAVMAEKTALLHNSTQGIVYYARTPAQRRRFLKSLERTGREGGFTARGLLLHGQPDPDTQSAFKDSFSSRSDIDNLQLARLIKHLFSPADLAGQLPFSRLLKDKLKRSGLKWSVSKGRHSKVLTIQRSTEMALPAASINRLPGRFEVLQTGPNSIIYDCAHNAAAFKQLFKRLLQSDNLDFSRLALHLFIQSDKKPARLHRLCSAFMYKLQQKNRTYRVQYSLTVVPREDTAAFIAEKLDSLPRRADNTCSVFAGSFLLYAPLVKNLARANQAENSS